MSILSFAGCRIIDLPVRGDHRGSLIAIELGELLPFAISRVYYIYGTLPEVSRGFHAHRALNQWMIAVSGSCTVLLDNGTERTEVRLDRPDQALELPPMVWHEMHDFSPDAVLIMVAEATYNEADYIRSYDEFQAALRNGER